MGSDGDAEALLERARRLCEAAHLAAAQLLPSLPPVSLAASRAEADGRGDRDRARSVESNKRRVVVDKLPQLPGQPMRAIHVSESDKHSKRKELEKIRQAQERARARIVRSNQQEQQDVMQKEEQQRLEAIEAAERCAEKTKVAMEGRLRAQERIRRRRLAAPQDQLRILSVSPPSRDVPPNAVTIGPVPRATITVRRRSPPIPASTSIVSEDTTFIEQSVVTIENEVERRLRERRIRLETAQRLQRAQAAREEEERNRRDAIAQSLEQYKNKQRELDRIAKGLGKSKPSLQLSPSWSQLKVLSSSSDDHSPLEEAKHDSSTEPESPIDSYEKHNPATESVASETLPALTIAVDTPCCTNPGLSSESKRKPKKTPPWRRPPVPLLPAESYAAKAIIQSLRLVNSADSYAERHKLLQRAHSPST